VISIRNCSRAYNDGESLFYALRDINLEIQEGEFVSLLGPSGSGKSTLMHLIGGLDRPTEGTLKVAGNNLSTLNDAKMAQHRNKTIGFVFQKFNLLARTTVLDNVMLPLLYSGGGIDRKSVAHDFLERVELASKAQNRVEELSGGEQQRVAIARALVNDPTILLADEPTGNLDTETGLQIFDLLADLHKRGKTVVIVTHDPSLAERTQRIIRLKDGEVVQ